MTNLMTTLSPDRARLVASVLLLDTAIQHIGKERTRLLQGTGMYTHVAIARDALCGLIALRGSEPSTDLLETAEVVQRQLDFLTAGRSSVVWADVMIASGFAVIAQTILAQAEQRLAKEQAAIVAQLDDTREVGG